MNYSKILAFAIALLSLPTLDAAELRRSKRLRGEQAENPEGIRDSRKHKIVVPHDLRALYNAQVDNFLTATQWLRTTKPEILKKALENCIQILDLYKTTNDQELKHELLVALDSERISLLYVGGDAAREIPLGHARYNFARATESLCASLLRKKLGCYETELKPWETTWALEKVAGAEFQRRLNETFENDQDKLDEAFFDEVKTFALMLLKKLRVN